MEEEKEVVRTAPITNCEMELCVNVILSRETVVKMFENHH